MKNIIAESVTPVEILTLTEFDPVITSPNEDKDDSQDESVDSTKGPSETQLAVTLLLEDDKAEAYGFSYLSQESYKKLPRRSADRDEPTQKEKFKGKIWPQVFSSFATNMGSMALGTVIAWTATALPDMRKSEAWKTLDSTQESWIGSIMTLGAAFSCPVAGFGIERFGRRMSMLLLTLPFLAGWASIYFAQNVSMLYAGRLLTGFCGGGFSIAAPVFITETADVKIRGALASGFELLVTVGILYILIIGTFTTWDVQALACAVWPIIFHGLMVFVPESPRFLIERGKEPEAAKALMWLRGAPSSAEVRPELIELKKSVADSRSRKGSWRDFFTSPVIKPTFIGLALMFFQQLSGIDAVTFYIVDIFKSAGSEIDGYLSANIFGVAQVVATLIAALVVDRCGRRLLLLISSLFMAISLSLLGLYFYLKLLNGGIPPEGLGWLPLLSLTVYILSFSTGFGPIPWIMLGELIPSQVKGLAAGIVTISRWLLGFVVTLLFQDLMNILGEHGGFWFFAGFCFIGTVYTYFFVPETKGKTLDEIQMYFQRDASPE